MAKKYEKGGGVKETITPALGLAPGLLGELLGLKKGGKATGKKSMKRTDRPSRKKRK